MITIQNQHLQGNFEEDYDDSNDDDDDNEGKIEDDKTDWRLPIFSRLLQGGGEQWKFDNKSY